jgi:hypothetical protein
MAWLSWLQLTAALFLAKDIFTPMARTAKSYPLPRMSFLLQRTHRLARIS